MTKADMTNRKEMDILRLLMCTKECPVPQVSSVDGWQRVPVRECGEALVAIGEWEERIVVRARYKEEMIPGVPAECLVRETVRSMLKQAASRLPMGVNFMVWDAWRPTAVQKVLFSREVARQMMRDQNTSLEDAEHIAMRVVSPPSTSTASPAPHLTGGAVDITLCDDEGNQLYMGTDFDDFSEVSETRYFETDIRYGVVNPYETRTARDNRRLLFHTMASVGFTNYPVEWWHYDYGNQFWAIIKEKSSAIYGPAAVTEA